MKLKIIVYILFVTLASCSSQQVKKNENVLLGDKVTVYNLEKLVNSEHPEEWLKGLEKDIIFESAFERILQENFTVYSPNSPILDTKIPYSNEKILEYGWSHSGKDYNELNELLFAEEWFVPNSFKEFSKIVNYWCPIQVWTNDEGKTLKRKLFFVLPSTNKKGKKIADDIFLNFELGLALFPHTTGMDDRKFINTAFDKIQSGQLKAYDPIYIVDKSKVPFSVDEAEEFIGEPLSSESLRNNVSSLIFEEDWYFDAESMNIYKEVHSLGFVKNYFEEGENKSKILFFILFE